MDQILGPSIIKLTVIANFSNFLSHIFAQTCSYLVELEPEHFEVGHFLDQKLSGIGVSISDNQIPSINFFF